MVYSDVVAQPGGIDLALAIWAEGYAVAIASGVVLDDVAGMHPERLILAKPNDRKVALEALNELMSRLGPTKASMLQDLERQARTEIDVINGGVVSQATNLGLTAPINQGIVDIVRACERQERRPGTNNLIDLQSLLK
jgi:2-dehydropantoate 2-reductase